MEQDYRPRYVRIKDALKEGIERGELAEGAQLPTEKELAQRFQVSRITVTTALRELTAEGWIYRVQGKGSFVKARSAAVSPLPLPPLENQRSLRQMVAEGGHRLLSFEERTASPTLCRDLAIPPGTPLFFFEKLKYVEDRPAVLERFVLPQSLCPRLQSLDPAGRSLLEILKREAGMQLGRDLVSTRPVAGEADVSALLGLPEGAALWHSEALVYDERDRPLFRAEYFYPRMTD